MSGRSKNPTKSGIQDRELRKKCFKKHVTIRTWEKNCLRFESSFSFFPFNYIYFET